MPGAPRRRLGRCRPERQGNWSVRCASCTSPTPTSASASSPAGCDPERGINQREADVYRAWHRAIDLAIGAGVDAVVHAGDLFDGPRPTPRALAEALDGFARLRDAGIPAIVIAGNHSTPRTRSGGSVFEVHRPLPGVHAVWEAPRRIDLGGTSLSRGAARADDGAVPRA